MRPAATFVNYTYTIKINNNEVVFRINPRGPSTWKYSMTLTEQGNAFVFKISIKIIFPLSKAVNVIY
jgi:hypothetical protein